MIVTLQTTIIRSATKADIEGAIDLLKEFQDESLAEYGMMIDAGLAKKTCLDYVDTSLVLECEGKVVGVIAGMITSIPTCAGKIYQEAVWFVSKPYRKYGIRLLKTLEENCIAQGITHIIMAHMMNSKSDKLDIFYRKSGFMPFEVHYIKSLIRR
jgi:N-acetylglutamate synthase-like GNAT family acetyltransferase